jgi:hypothetical protein
MSMRKSLKTVALLTGLGLAGVVGGVATVAPDARAAPPAKPAVSEEISAVLARMGKSLLSEQFSFQARTLRVYAEASGQPLHISHSMKVTVRRPNRMLVDLTGDDGATKLYYDGKTVVVYGVETKKYVVVPVPDTIQGMLDQLVGKGGVDFPLADFLTDAPDKAFLTGVTSGREINTVTIDGVPCLHLLFIQPPGIELELWVEKNDRALPRRLVATYRSEPAQPSFVAELYDWNFDPRSTDATFAFQPPEGAVRTEARAPTQQAPTPQTPTPRTGAKTKGTAQ